jgi:hypothetical protein
VLYYYSCVVSVYFAVVSILKGVHGVILFLRSICITHIGWQKSFSGKWTDSRVRMDGPLCPTTAAKAEDGSGTSAPEDMGRHAR